MASGRVEAGLGVLLGMAVCRQAARLAPLLQASIPKQVSSPRHNQPSNDRPPCRMQAVSEDGPHAPGHGCALLH